MNVYDFDDTIFRGDSTRAFWAYCLKRAPGLARFLPRQCAAAVRFASLDCPIDAKIAVIVVPKLLPRRIGIAPARPRMLVTPSGPA